MGLLKGNVFDVCSLRPGCREGSHLTVLFQGFLLGVHAFGCLSWRLGTVVHPFPTSNTILDQRVFTCPFDDGGHWEGWSIPFWLWCHTLGVITAGVCGCLASGHHHTQRFRGSPKPPSAQHDVVAGILFRGATCRSVCLVGDRCSL